MMNSQSTTKQSDLFTKPLYFNTDKSMGRVSGFCTSDRTSLTYPKTPSAHSLQLQQQGHARYWLNSKNYYLSLNNGYFAVANDHCTSVIDESTLLLSKKLLSSKKSFVQIKDSLPHYNDTCLQEALSELCGVGVLSTEVEPSKTAQPGLLSAWISVTERCNLRCDYCFKPASSSMMTFNTGRTVVDDIVSSARAHNYDSIEITYGGGEPLLNFKNIIKIHAYTLELSKKYLITINSVIVTNGLLISPKVIDSLKEHGIKLIISLDGISMAHNHSRRNLRGGDTSSAVMEKIDLCASLGLPAHISITLSNANISGLSEMVEWILSRGLTFSIALCREANGGHHPLDLKKSIESLKDMFSMIERKLSSIKSLVGLLDQGDFISPHKTACSAGKSHLVYDSIGQLYACPMETSPVNKLIDNDSINTIRIQADPMFQVEVDKKEECSICPWKYWCAGGCPQNTYRSTGRTNIKSPYCDVYKIIFPEVLRLESIKVLQRIKEKTDGVS